MTNSSKPDTDKRAKTNKTILKVFGVVVGVIVLIAVFGAVFGGDDESAPEAATTTTTTAPAKSSAKASSPSKQPTKEKKVEAPEALRTEIAEISDKAKVKIKGGQVTVRYPIAENLTMGLTRTGAQMDTVAMLQAVDDSSVKHKVTVIDGTYRMQDQYGKVSREAILHVAYSKTVLGKIQYDNVDRSAIWELADIESFVHPELQGD